MSRSLLSWMCVIDSVLPRHAEVSCKHISGGTSLSCQRGHPRRLPDDDEQPYWDGLLPPLLYPCHEPGSNVYLSKLIHVFVKVVNCICQSLVWHSCPWWVVCQCHSGSSGAFYERAHHDIEHHHQACLLLVSWASLSCIVWDFSFNCQLSDRGCNLKASARAA